MKLTSYYNLQTERPHLVKEWHPTNNLPEIPGPRWVTHGSHEKVWWICKKGHEWQAIIADRNAGSGCPYCSGKAVCEDNCLQTLNPDLAKEWHPSKNGILTPKNVTSSSNKKVWWQCKNGHEWQATIANRNAGHGCQYCYMNRVKKVLAS